MQGYQYTLNLLTSKIAIMKEIRLKSKPTGQFLQRQQATFERHITYREIVCQGMLIHVDLAHFSPFA